MIAELTHTLCAFVPAAELRVIVLLGLTVILMLFDVAGEPVKHGVALLVKTTVTASLLFNVVVVNVALLVPAFTPFTFH